jgi:hypothetical protein
MKEMVIACLNHEIQELFDDAVLFFLLIRPKLTTRHFTALNSQCADQVQEVSVGQCLDIEIDARLRRG